MAGLLSWTLLGIGLGITGGTLLSLSRHPHWLLRMWDFPQVRFLVQPDVPSIHTQIELRSGVRICFYGLHPRPPNPLREQSATPRNAELLIVGNEIRQHHQPTVVAGDLNDVGWSKTTKRFWRLSRLLDPRVGRGLYNTHNANNPLVRWPLDHVFHCACFTLGALQRLLHIGSDHFPIYIELCYEPEAPSAAPPRSAAACLEPTAQEQIKRALRYHKELGHARSDCSPSDLGWR